jgi:menaquinone-specific isochorismate synthase
MWSAGVPSRAPGGGKAGCRVRARSLYWPAVAQPLTIVDRSPWDRLNELRTQSSGPCFAWASPDGDEIVGVGAVAWISASGADRFDEVRGQIADAFRAARPADAAPGSAAEPIAVGGFSFAPRDPDRAGPGLPDALFFIPERTFSRRAGQPMVETRWTSDRPAGAAPDRADPAGDLRDPGDRAAEWDRARWNEAIRETLDRVRAGTISKAVLARSIEIGLDPSGLFRIAEALRSSYPGCYRFLLSDGHGRAFLGASPERLVRLMGNEISTEAVAGTLGCEEDVDADALSKALEHSAKDRSEHRIVLDHLLETLRPLTRSIEVPVQPEVMRLRHLLHLRTRVRAVAGVRTRILDLVERLHPTPAVAGWPRDESLTWIRTVEPRDREWYAGPIGWMNASGEGDFAVGIRSLAIRDGRATVFAGAGIVDGSDPDLEWKETELKMRGILDAIAGR